MSEKFKVGDKVQVGKHIFSPDLVRPVGEVVRVSSKFSVSARFENDTRIFDETDLDLVEDPVLKAAHGRLAALDRERLRIDQQEKEVLDFITMYDKLVKGEE